MCHACICGFVTSFPRDLLPRICGIRHLVLRETRVTRARRRETVDNHGAAYTHCTRPGNRCPSRPPHASLPSSLRFRHLVSAGIFICYLVGRAGRPAGSIGERLRALNSPFRSGAGCLEDPARRDASPVREATSARRGRTARAYHQRTVYAKPCVCWWIEARTVDPRRDPGLKTSAYPGLDRNEDLQTR